MRSRLFLTLSLAASLAPTPAASAQNLKRWSVTRDVSQTGASDEIWTSVVDESAQRIYAAGWYPISTTPDVDVGFVIAYDLDGQLVWSRSLPNTPPRSTWIYRLALHPSGGVVSVGEEGDLQVFNTNVFVARVDAQGAVMWSTTWDGASQESDFGAGVVVDSNGDIHVSAGSWVNAIGAHEGMYLRFDSSGNPLTPLPVATPPEAASGGHIELVPGGGVQIATRNRLTRFLTTGQIAWSTLAANQAFGKFRVAFDGTTYVATSVSLGPFQISRYDGGGAHMWTTPISDAQHPVGSANDVELHPSGIVVAAGVFSSDFTQTAPFVVDGLVAVLDSAGAVQWTDSATFQSAGVHAVEALEVTVGGDIVVQGVAVDAAAGRRMNVTRLESNGNVCWSTVPNTLSSSSILCAGVHSIDHEIVIAVSSTAPGFGFTTPADLNITRLDETKPAYCFGDGSSAACPCGNFGGSGNGCPSSVAVDGARLVGVGRARIAVDELELISTFVPNGPALYFQATGTSDAPFGDGKLCTTGGITRLAVVFANGNESALPNAHASTPLHAAGGASAGSVLHYQVWYRDAEPTFCTSALFNLTNAVTATWAP